MIAAVEAGVEVRTLAPRINAAQTEVDALESVVERTKRERQVMGREELAALLDETAINFPDLFASDSDPAEVNNFLTSIKMRARLDLSAHTAAVTADLTPILAPTGVGCVRVRGGT